MARSKPLDNRITILIGAPKASDLSWTETHLTAPLHGVFEDDLIRGISEQLLDSTSAPPASRVPPPERKHIPTGLTQATPLPVIGPSGPDSRAKAVFRDIALLALPNASWDEQVEALSQSSDSCEDNQSFIEQSLSSLTESQETSTLSTISSTSHSPTSNPSSPLLWPGPQQIYSDFLCNVGPVTSLSNIPNMMHIFAAQPQVLSRSIIVVVLAISPPRTIESRSRGIPRQSEFVALTVADETRSAFGVNLWLDPLAVSRLPGLEVQNPVSDGKNQSLRQGMSYRQSWSSTIRSTTFALRPHDVILVRHARLQVHQEKVYASSWPDFTRLELLYRPDSNSFKGKRDDQGPTCRIPYSSLDVSRAQNSQVDYVLEKTARVSKWVDGFVRIPESRASKRGSEHLDADSAKQRKKLRGLALLPEDTQ